MKISNRIKKIQNFGSFLIGYMCYVLVWFVPLFIVFVILGLDVIESALAAAGTAIWFDWLIQD